MADSISLRDGTITVDLPRSAFELLALAHGLGRRGSHLREEDRGDMGVDHVRLLPPQRLPEPEAEVRVGELEPPGEAHDRNPLHLGRSAPRLVRADHPDLVASPGQPGGEVVDAVLHPADVGGIADYDLEDSHGPDVTRITAPDGSRGRASR